MSPARIATPAFPVAASNGHTPGMTLRQYIATEAMAAILTSSFAIVSEETISNLAYKQADAMIAEDAK